MQKIKFIFQVTLWEDDVLKVNKLISITRVHQRTARDIMIKRYPRPYFFELYSTQLK